MNNIWNYVDIIFLLPAEIDILLRMLSVCAGIYAFYNLKTGNYYIGSASKTLKERLRHYFYPNFQKKYGKTIFGKAIKKYGQNNFLLLILKRSASPNRHG